jgi:hypothetical protein
MKSTANDTSMPPGSYGVRHIDRWNVSVASCKASKCRHQLSASAVLARRAPGPLWSENTMHNYGFT